MSRALIQETLRAIKGSLGRFVAIMGIVALGCGFFSGLQMTGRDMRLAADEFYDTQGLYDIRVVSTLGFERADINRLAAIEGVEAALPSRSADVMATIHSTRMVTRVIELPADGAAASENSDAAQERPFNQPVLTEGRWPVTANEVVISSDPKKHNDVPLGSTIDIPESSGGVHLKGGAYTVVGYVNAPTFPSSNNFGSTSLGNGVVEEFAYVPAAAFEENDPYTDVYLQVKEARASVSGSDAYKSAIASVENRIEDELPSLARARVEDVRKEAQRSVDEARAAYDESRLEADRKLGDARSQLDDAQAQIEASESKLSAGKREAETGTSRLEAEKVRVQRQLAAAREELDASAQKISEGRALLAAGEEQYVAGAAQLAQGQADYEESFAAFDNARAQALAVLSSQGITASTLEEAKAQLEAVGYPTDDIDALLAAQARLQAADAELKQKQTELVAAREALDAQTANLNDAQQKLSAGEKAYQAAVCDSNTQFASAQEKLDAAVQELTEGRAKLDSARQQHSEGQRRYEEAKAEAEAQLSDAKAQIDEAQKKVDELEAPDMYVLNRTKDRGNVAYDDDSHRIDDIANVFPLMFFLVAALIALTTMTRMVSEERTVIGMHKALGYSKGAIAAKYVLYAASASSIGAVLGIALLSQILPGIIISAYASIYTIPHATAALPVSLPIALLSGGLGVGVTLLATVFAVLSTLREEPSALMLPKAPKAGSRVLLERMTPIWKRLSFSWKVSVRNLFRFKRRLCMTLIGIAGCTALVLVAFGVQDSINDVINAQWPGIFQYDYIVGMKQEATLDDIEAVQKSIVAVTRTAADKVVSDDVAVVRRENVLLSSASVPKDKAVSVSAMSPLDAKRFEQVVTLRERTSQQPLEFTGDSVVLSEKIAKKLNVQVGDTITVYEQDRIGNVADAGRPLTVTGITENYAWHYMYLGVDAEQSLGSRENISYALLFSAPNDETIRQHLGDELSKDSRVATASDINATIKVYRESLAVVGQVVAILIISAALLAFIVLYNLTNINIEERIREIASLKVLGFTRREVDAYVFREVFLLTLGGSGLGLVLGSVLEGFVVQTAEVDTVMFGRVIHPLSFVYAFGLTLLFSLLVYVAMRRKLAKIDMVESLKSVD
ncbi:FtsX-like permease family protein [Lancefieldella sp. Marseille-Q7238]|uniref:FtsX-like permease family protein n=1 Tax=Lancefieldella sp. Marseille-Q7238 TaxID=3022127 RepID=UPI0024A84CB5|nr:FtsX-like permease family protein [Lancefieldella sp. Marseille-Q7238]